MSGHFTVVHYAEGWLVRAAFPPLVLLQADRGAVARRVQDPQGLQSHAVHVGCRIQGSVGLLPVPNGDASSDLVLDRAAVVIAREEVCCLFQMERSGSTGRPLKIHGHMSQSCEGGETCTLMSPELATAWDVTECPRKGRRSVLPPAMCFTMDSVRSWDTVKTSMQARTSDKCQLVELLPSAAVTTASSAVASSISS
jgi:hypothetical protein